MKKRYYEVLVDEDILKSKTTSLSEAKSTKRELQKESVAYGMPRFTKVYINYVEEIGDIENPNEPLITKKWRVN